MTPPARVEPNQIWLARYDDDPARGYYQASDLTYAQLAQFIRKLTIGDATKDSDDHISSWILGNFSGGGQAEHYNDLSCGAAQAIAAYRSSVSGDTIGLIAPSRQWTMIGPAPSSGPISQTRHQAIASSSVPP